jgi:hypothetical protein
MIHGGVCALAVGNGTIAAVIESIKNKAVAIAAVLCLAVSIFLFSPIILSRKERNQHLSCELLLCSSL